MSHADSSPRRSADDDDDEDDDECVDERRRVHGTSTVTSRSGSPAVDSTTDCCSLAAGDVRTPVDRSNEPSLLSVPQTSLDNDETPARCSDKPQRESEHDDVVNVADLPTVDRSATDCDTAPQTSVLPTTDTVNVADITPDTQNNLARLEIMTCIAGGNVDHRQNTAALQMDTTLRPRRGHAGASVARSMRPVNGRCDGRRARAGHSRTRNGALTAACSVSDALANYRCASIFNGDSVNRNCVSEFRRDSRDITRDLESTLAFAGSTYSDTARYMYSDLTADSLFSSDSYPVNSVSSVYQQHQQQQPSQSYGAPNDSRFQSATVAGRPSSPPSLHCNVTSVRSDGDSFTSFPYPPIHSAASFPVCDPGWQTWKDWRWNDCASFPASVFDYDDEYLLQVSGDHVNWRPSVDTRGWTNGGHDIGNDVIRTSLPANQVMGATRRSYWSGDCSSGYRCTSNYVMPYYDGSSASSRATANCCMPPTAASRFYDGQCCYVPASTSLSAGGAADGQELTPCQSVYQSCKYSGVVDGQCRQYSADESGCSLPPAFVNSA